jgi:hypothetical protein
LVLHYKISPEIEEKVILALKGLFNISEEEKFVSTQDFIQFTDMIPFPKFVQLLELG